MLHTPLCVGEMKQAILSHWALGKCALDTARITCSVILDCFIGFSDSVFVLLGTVLHNYQENIIRNEPAVSLSDMAYS